MFGEPKDVEGECNAHLYIADNHADNHATMRCQLPKGHSGRHQEEFNRENGSVLVYWYTDERDYAQPAKDAFDKYLTSQDLTGADTYDLNDNPNLTIKEQGSVLVDRFLLLFPEHKQWEKEIKEHAAIYECYVSRTELYGG